MPTDAEVIAKATTELLKDNLETELGNIEAEWVTSQTFSSHTVASALTLPSDTLRLEAPSYKLGYRLDILGLESYTPLVYVTVADEVPITQGEQTWANYEFTLGITVVIQGADADDTRKRLYRYADAIRRVIMADREILGAVQSVDFPTIAYEGLIPEEAQIRAVGLAFTVTRIVVI